MKKSRPVVKVERLYKIQRGPSGPTKAFCDILMLDSFLVKGLRVIQGKDGLFVSMPKEFRDGRWYNTFSPTSVELRKGLQELILEAYHKEVTEEENGDWEKGDWEETIDRAVRIIEGGK